MPGVVGAIVGIAASVGSAVVSIASALGGIIGGLTSTISGALAGIGSAITSAISGLVSGIGGLISGIGQGIAATLKGMVKVITDIIALPGQLFSGQLSIDFSAIGLAIDLEAAHIGAILDSTIMKIMLPVTTIVTTVKMVFLTPVKELVEIIDEPATAILTPIKETLQIVKGAVDTIKAPVDTLAGSFQQIRETISDIASLKIVDEILADTTDISELLGPIAEGESVKTAQAIATLAKSIAGTTVATMDKIDTEYKLLGATMDTFNEQIATSVKDQMALAKAEVLIAVTPKMTTLGDNQQKVISGLARVSRHIEDQSWFMAMFLRMLK